MHDEEASLYRHFDAEGRLLYVGVSISAVARLVQHAHQSPWFALIASITVERFPTREAALQAEAAAIVAEAPLHNRARPKDAPRPPPPPPAGKPKRIRTALHVKTAPPGSHSVSGARGLRLIVRATGARSWVARVHRDGKARDFGLGPASWDGRDGGVTLAQARSRAAIQRGR